MKFFIGPVLATLFILSLFPFSINLIVNKDDSFGFDDSKFKRNLLFFLVALQFLPVLLGLGLMVAEDSSKADADIQMILAEQFIANFLFLLAALVVKFGNYQKQESDSF